MPYPSPKKNNPLMLLVMLISVAQAAEDEERARDPRE